MHWTAYVPTAGLVLTTIAYVVYMTIWLIRVESRIATHEAECARNKANVDERHRNSQEAHSELKGMIISLTVKIDPLIRLDIQVSELKGRLDYFVDDANHRLSSMGDKVTTEVGRLTEALMRYGIPTERRKDDR
jgi:hypothetical protein